MKKLCNEESAFDKIKKKSGVIAIIGAGFLGLLHILSHLIPAMLAISYVTKHEHEQEQIVIFGFDINSVLSHPIVQIAFIGFVFMSFYYIYKDHQHHKHERIIQHQLVEALAEIEQLKSKSNQCQYIEGWMHQP